MISKHISEKEATKSVTALRLGIDNTPDGDTLNNMKIVAEKVFELPVRVGIPQGFGGLVDVVSGPSYATSVGLVMHGSRQMGGSVFGRKKNDKNVYAKVKTRKKQWLGEFF